MTNSELLEGAGFKESVKTGVVWLPWWVNVGARMAFSSAAVEDADFEWLSDRSRAASEGDEFLFYFADGETMNVDLCEAILMQYGIENLKAIPQGIVPKS